MSVHDLIHAVSNFRTVQIGASIATPQGDRQVLDVGGARLLSDAFRVLFVTAVRELDHAFNIYGVPCEPPRWFCPRTSESPNGPWEEVPSDQIKCRQIDMRAQGSDLIYLTAVMRVHRACLFAGPIARRCPVFVTTSNQRFQPGDVIPQREIAILESVQHLLQMVEAGPPPEQRLQPDGVLAPRTVMFKGRAHECDLSKKEMAFLSICLSKDQIHFESVMSRRPDAVWREHYSGRKRNKVSKFLCRLNQTLQRASPTLNVRFSVHKGTDFIDREVGPTIPGRL